MRIRPRLRLGLTGVATVLLCASTLTVAAGVPARADIPVISDFDDIVSFAQTAYSAYDLVTGNPSDLDSAVNSIEAQLTQVKTQIIDEIDNAQIADLTQCANTNLNSFENIQILTTDSIQAFATAAFSCAAQAEADLGELSDPAAIDQAGAALNTIGPIALFALTFAGENTALLKQTLVTGNQEVLTRLAPTCLTSVFSLSEVTIADENQTVTGHGVCYDYAVPPPGQPDYNIPVVSGSGAGRGEDPWTVTGDAVAIVPVPNEFLYDMEWQPITDYSIAINQAMAATSYPIAQAALYQLEDAAGPAGPAVAAAASATFDAPVQLFKADSAGNLLYDTQTNPGNPFTDWDTMDGQLQSVVAASNADGRVELFGVNRIGEVFHRWQQVADDDSSWSPWAQMDGTLNSIAVARNQDGTLQVFGTNPAGQVFTRHQILGGDYDPAVRPASAAPAVDNWTSWTQMDGSYTQVAAATNQNGDIELFGLNAAGDVLDRQQTAPDATDPSVTGAWTAWGVVSDVAATSIAVGTDVGARLELFGVSAADGDVLQRAQTAVNSSSWTAWTDLPGAGMHGLAAASDAVGNIELFGIDANGQASYRLSPQLDNSWTAWTAIPATPAGLPVVTPPGDQQTNWQSSAGLALSATGGTPPYTYSVTGLPSGLSASPNGQISGTAAAIGGYTVSVLVQDLHGRTATASFTWSVTAIVVPDVLSFSKSSAAASLRAAGLTVGKITLDTHCVDAAGTVIAQNPLAGDELPEGGAVNLTVSSGTDSHGRSCDQ